MIIGVPKEIKDHETRVGLTPNFATVLREAGHEVLVETRAGEASTLSDEEYTHAGATIVPSASDVWSRADLVVKVKEPQPSESTCIFDRASSSSHTCTGRPCANSQINCSNRA